MLGRAHFRGVLGSITSDQTEVCYRKFLMAPMLGNVIGVGCLRFNAFVVVRILMWVAGRFRAT